MLTGAADVVRRFGGNRRRVSRRDDRPRQAMAEVVDLAAVRPRADWRDATSTTPGGPVRAEFYFDLTSPFTYFAAERVQRAFAEVTWTPAYERVVRSGAVALEDERAAAGARAAALRLPLVWPERWPRESAAAMRAAAYAGTQGRAGAFVVAACRLAWAGGFDLGDHRVLVDAAAAANLSSPQELVRAAEDASLDGAIESAARRIAAAGADRLPAILIRRAVFVGDEQVEAAAAYARSTAAGGA